MKNKSIEEMNRVIADFTGCEKEEQKWRSPQDTTAYLIYNYWTPVKKLEFHSSWDWLMPVVEKISKIPLLNVDNTPCEDYIDTCYPITFNMPTETGKVMFRFKGFSLHESDKLIEAVHTAVFEVAEYHNQIKPTTNAK